MSGRQMNSVRRGTAQAIAARGGDISHVERLAAYGIRGIVTRMMPVFSTFGQAFNSTDFLPVSLPRVRILDGDYLAAPHPALRATLSPGGERGRAVAP